MADDPRRVGCLPKVVFRRTVECLPMVVCRRTVECLPMVDGPRTAVGRLKAVCHRRAGAVEAARPAAGAVAADETREADALAAGPSSAAAGG